jgi:hypothetical protein
VAKHRFLTSRRSRAVPGFSQVQLYLMVGLAGQQWFPRCSGEIFGRFHELTPFVQCRPLLIVGESRVLEFAPQVQVMAVVTLTPEADARSNAGSLGRVRLRVLTTSIRFNSTQADHVHPAVDACHKSQDVEGGAHSRSLKSKTAPRKATSPAYNASVPQGSVWLCGCRNAASDAARQI